MGKKWTQEQKDRARLKRERAYFHHFCFAWIRRMDAAKDIVEAGEATGDFVHAMCQGWCSIPSCLRIARVAEDDWATIFGPSNYDNDHKLLDNLNHDFGLIDELLDARIIGVEQHRNARSFLDVSFITDLSSLGMGYWGEAWESGNYSLVVAGMQAKADALDKEGE